MYREAVIIRHVRDKDVLDCGGVDHWAFEMKESRGDWLHSIVAREARAGIGVDILESHVNRINRDGKYRFVQANVESLPFENEFDVVLAGEIVEHIYNMGLFLDSAWKALRPRGVLIITTPNKFRLTGMLYGIVLGRERCHPEHTCHYSPQTLSYVVGRHGFTIEEIHLLPRRARSRFVQFFRSLVCMVRPLLAETIVLVARKSPGQKKYEDKW